MASGIFIKDEAGIEPRPMPYGITKALKSLPSGALSSLATVTLYNIYAVGIKR